MFGGKPLLLAADNISSHHNSDWGGKDHRADGAVSSAPRCGNVSCALVALPKLLQGGCAAHVLEGSSQLINDMLA
jgi:hypothetical protein